MEKIKRLYTRAANDVEELGAEKAHLLSRSADHEAIVETKDREIQRLTRAVSGPLLAPHTLLPHTIVGRR